MKKIIELLALAVLLAAGVYLGSRKLAIFYCNQGLDYYSKGSYNEAISSFKKSININASAAVVHNNLAYAYEQTREFEKAIGEYQKAISLEPGYISAYLGLSRAYWKRRMYLKSLDVLKQAEVKFPGNKDIKELSNYVSFDYMADCLNNGVAAFLSQNKKTAFVLLNRAQEIKPERPTVWLVTRGELSVSAVDDVKDVSIE